MLINKERGHDRPLLNERSFPVFVRPAKPADKLSSSCLIAAVKPRAKAASQRRLTAVLAALLLVQMVLPTRLMAQTATTGSLDLGSKDRSITVDNRPGFQPTSIKVGDHNKTVNVGDMLTPAEYAALNQV